MPSIMILKTNVPKIPITEINNDIKNTEWTMTRYGEGTSNFFAYGIVIAGYVSNTLDTLERLIRPVFYLTSDITISGKGTIDNPFVVNL